MENMDFAIGQSKRTAVTSANDKTAMELFKACMVDFDEEHPHYYNDFFKALNNIMINGYNEMEDSSNSKEGEDKLNNDLEVASTVFNEMRKLIEEDPMKTGSACTDNLLESLKTYKLSFRTLLDRKQELQLKTA